MCEVVVRFFSELRRRPAGDGLSPEAGLFQQGLPVTDLKTAGGRYFVEFHVAAVVGVCVMEVKGNAGAGMHFQAVSK